LQGEDKKNCPCRRKIFNDETKLNNRCSRIKWRRRRRRRKRIEKILKEIIIIKRK